MSPIRRGKGDEVGVGAYLRLSWTGWGEGGRLFEAGRLLTFSAFRMGAYSRLGAYSNKHGSSILKGHIGYVFSTSVFHFQLKRLR